MSGGEFFMIEANRHADYGKALGAVDQETLGPEAAARVTQMLELLPIHRATPLRTLVDVAKTLGVQSVHIKDESRRLGLGSFKALGGAYAVVCLVLEEASRLLKRNVAPSELLAPEVRSLVAQMTVGCATDGNHGRSVAAGANLVGCKASIFVHDNVNRERVDAIARFGARLIHVPGNYDDAVAEAERVCHSEGWTIVSDTSWPGYERIPRLVMQGYTAMVAEALAQLPKPPTHVFLQAGVGGFAASVAANISLTLGAARPKFIIVEPDRAACLFESNRVGEPIKIEAGEPTVMAMLECYEPSLLAWGVLSRVADAYMTVCDEDAVAAMNQLARPRDNSAAIIAGESGGAGLAGLIAVTRDGDARTMLDLNAKSRVLLFNTEGATAPEVYRKLTSMDPAEMSLIGE
jgi:diaminopropionate ammonia-lyase